MLFVSDFIKSHRVCPAGPLSQLAATYFANQLSVVS